MTLWETIGKVVLQYELRENILNPVWGLPPAPCMLMSSTACSENPFLRSCFVALRLFNQIIPKRKHWVKNNKQSGLVGQATTPSTQKTDTRESKFKATMVYIESSRSARIKQRLCLKQTTTKQTQLTASLQCQAIP